MIEFIRNETTLMAYADGELGLPLAAALEEEMRRDPQLVSELVGFIRTRRAAKAAMMSNPYRDRVPDILQNPPLAARSHSRLYGRAPALLLAAGVAFAAFFGGTLLDLWQPKGLLLLLESPELAEALSSKPSGSEVKLDGRTLRLVGTFQAPSAVCREAEISGEGERTNAVMCRSANGWSPSLTMTTRERGYEPAAGGALIDTYLAGMGAQRVPQGTELQVLADEKTRGK